MQCMAARPPPHVASGDYDGAACCVLLHARAHALTRVDCPGASTYGLVQELSSGLAVAMVGAV